MNRTLFSLLIIAILLLAAGCVVNQPNVAGRINGHEITYGAFMNSYRAHYNNFQVLNNRVPDKEENELIKRQTWLDATKHVILTEYFEKYDIDVSPQEAIDTLKVNIPEYIRASPKFMIKGVFDPNIYLQSLLYDTPENLQPLRLDYQEYKIPIMKLQRQLLADELLTPAERKLVDKIIRSKADLNWTILDPKTISPIVTEEEILAFYQTNQELYKLDSWYSVAWTSFKVSPSKTDIKASQVLADSLYLRLSQGQAWAELDSLPEFSTVLPKNSGFVRNLDLDPEIYALLSSLEPGLFSKPVHDTEGTTIYQLEERTKSMCSFNTFRVPYMPSDTSIALERPRIDTALKLAKTIGLEAASGEMDLSFQRSGKLSPKSNWLNSLDFAQDVLSQIRLSESGSLLDPVYSRAEQSWMLLEVQENRLDSMKQLPEVREAIIRDLSAVKRVEMAKNLAERVLAGQADVPSDAGKLELTDMTLGSTLMGVKAESHLYQALRRHYLKQKQTYFLVQDMVLIPMVIAVTTDEQMVVSPSEIKRVFNAYQPADWFEAWMAGKVEKARVNILMR